MVAASAALLRFRKPAVNESSTAPHRLVLDRPGFCALVAAASLLLSLWAVYLDPVINSAGVSDVRAAGYFLDARWGAAIDTAGQPLYAFLGAAIGRLTDMSTAHSFYTLNAGLFALLAIGFVALVSVLGGGDRARLLAAALVLLFPTLNGFRPQVAAEPGYWASYVWSLAYFVHYAAAAPRGIPAGWLLAGAAASLFALEALLFLAVVPLWLYVHDRFGGAGRVLKVSALLVGGALLLVYALWVQQWRGPIPAGELLRDPLAQLFDSWQDTTRALGFRLEALRSEFLDQYSQGFDRAALLVSVLVVCAAGVIKSLGLVYAALAAYGLAVSRRVVAGNRCYWWAVFAVVSVVLLLVPALIDFAVDDREAMIAALTLMAVVPNALERLWSDRSAGVVNRRRLLLLALVLVLVSGLRGLDLRSQQLHLREAGLWLRAAAAPDSSLYSNSPVVVHYTGLNGYRAGADYSWREAVHMIRQDHWRDYRYLALVVDAGAAHREGILMRVMDLEPVKTFTGNAGGRVLIFDTRR